VRSGRRWPPRDPIYDDPVTTGSVWGEFEHDPRDPQYAGMRASDRDRAVVHEVLVAAYAEGRLDLDEFGERTAAVTAAKTYAELLPPIRDLTADAAPVPFTPAPSGDLGRQARRYYSDKLREAFFGFLIPNLIVWAIWFMAGHDGFVWPIFVLIPTGANLARVVASRGAIIEERVQKLQRRQAKALEAPKGRPRQDGAALGEILDQAHEKPEEA
jgi:hypothetical protein